MSVLAASSLLAHLPALSLFASVSLHLQLTPAQLPFNLSCAINKFSRACPPSYLSAHLARSLSVNLAKTLNNTFPRHRFFLLSCTSKPQKPSREPLPVPHVLLTHPRVPFLQSRGGLKNSLTHCHEYVPPLFATTSTLSLRTRLFRPLAHFTDLFFPASICSQLARHFRSE